MSLWKVVAIACACAWAGTALAQTPPPALPTKPKVLTVPNPFDGGAAVVTSGTGFLLGWHSGPDFQTNGTAVFARLFSNKGVPVNPIATLRKRTPGLTGRPKFADLLQGKFAVVWQSVTQDFNQTQFIEGGIFNTASNTIGKITTIGNVTSPVHDVIRMSTGNIAVLSQQQSKNSAKQQIVINTRNGTTFAKLKGPVAVNGNGDTDIGQSYDHTVVARQAGGFAIYRNRDASPNVLLMRGFNQDAVLDANPIQVNSTPFLIGISGNDLLKFSVRAARLSNNNIIVTWAHFLNTNSSYEVRARLFNNAGTPLGNDFQVNTVTTGDQYWPKPIALLNGKFAIAWLADGEAANERRHYIRGYNATGVAAGAPVLTQKANPSSVTVDNSLARLSDKSLVDAYHDSTNDHQERVLGDGIPAAQLPAATGPSIDINDLQ
jgi:hypothetical protein